MLKRISYKLKRILSQSTLKGSKSSEQDNTLSYAIKEMFPPELNFIPITKIPENWILFISFNETYGKQLDNLFRKRLEKSKKLSATAFLNTKNIDNRLLHCKNLIEYNLE